MFVRSLTVLGAVMRAANLSCYILDLWVYIYILLESHEIISYFFFFQAEDGIRDYKVTGVQTCALPICRQVRITSQLILVKDQTHVWAETYDRDMSSFLGVQTELGRAISTQVQIRLDPDRKSVV